MYEPLLEPKVVKVELMPESDVIQGMQTYEVTYEDGEVRGFLANSCELMRTSH
jgi:hypothetical protein